jgi:hypothetical protein
MVVVAGASTGGLVVSGAASTALQSAEAIDVQLLSVHEHVRDAALSGTAFLVSHTYDDGAALTTAGRQVDAELATLKASSDLSPNEESALAHRPVGLA